MPALVIGLDPHKASNTIAVLDAEERLVARRRFENTAKPARIAIRLWAYVNLIEMNPTPLTRESAWRDARIKRISRTAGSTRVNVTIRDTRGRDIDAACGQLRALSGKPGLRS